MRSPVPCVALPLAIGGAAAALTGAWMWVTSGPYWIGLVGGAVAVVAVLAWALAAPGESARIAVCTLLTGVALCVLGVFVGHAALSFAVVGFCAVVLGVLVATIGALRLKIGAKSR